MTTQKCPACERGNLVPRLTKPSSQYRHLKKLVGEREVAIPTCDNCGEEVINKALAAELDAVLEETLGHKREQIIELALKRMAEVAPQREWERRLGVSPGYLSRLKAGKESSVPLVTLIAIIGQEPRYWSSRIEELWVTGGTLPTRPVLTSSKWHTATTLEISPGRPQPPVERAKLTATVQAEPVDLRLEAA